MGRMGPTPAPHKQIGPAPGTSRPWVKGWRSLGPLRDISRTRGRCWFQFFSNFGRAFDRFRRSALRQSAKLLTAQDIAQHAMAGRGLNTSDKRLVRLVGKRVGLDIPTVNAVMRANVRSPQSRDEGVAVNVPATWP